MSTLGARIGSGKLLYSVQRAKKIQKLGAPELFDYAVKLLAARASSTAELGAKLRRKAERAEDVDDAIARLKELNYLDDGRFAENFASSRVENSGFGRMRVLSDLRARRVSQKLADRAVDAAFEGKDEDALIDAYISRRIPGLAEAKATGESDANRAKAERRMAAACRRLRRAGFRSGAILAALKRLGAPADMEVPAEDEQAEP